jgi:hypothetical protein
MIAVDNLQLTLWRQSVMFNRGSYRNEWVTSPVKNEHRTPVVLQNGPQRSLIGIIEIPGIFDV